MNTSNATSLVTRSSPGKGGGKGHRWVDPSQGQVDAECFQEPLSSPEKECVVPAERSVYIGSKPSRLLLTSTSKATALAIHSSSGKGKGKGGKGRWEEQLSEETVSSQERLCVVPVEKTVYIGSKPSRRTSTSTSTATALAMRSSAGKAGGKGPEGWRQKRQSQVDEVCLENSPVVEKNINTVCTSPKKSQQSSHAWKLASHEQDLNTALVATASKPKILRRRSLSARAFCREPDVEGKSPRKCSRRSASQGRSCGGSTASAPLFRQIVRKWASKPRQVVLQHEAARKTVAAAAGQACSTQCALDNSAEQSLEIDLCGWRWGECRPTGAYKTAVSHRAHSEGPATRLWFASSLASDRSKTVLTPTFPPGVLLPASAVCTHNISTTVVKASLATAIDKMGLPAPPRRVYTAVSWDWPLSRNETAVRVQSLRDQLLSGGR